MLNKMYERIKEFIVENFKFIIFLILMFAFFMIELPYVIYTPGGAINLDKRISVENGYESEGQLQMAYVSMVKGSTPFVILSFVMPNWDLEAKENITYDNETMEDMSIRDNLDMRQSIDNATIEAYLLTGNEIEITKVINNVSYITEEADTDIKVGDIITHIDDNEVGSLEDLKTYVLSKKKDDEVTITVIRSGKEKKCSAKVYETADGLKVGIQIVNTYEYVTDPKLEIKSKAKESGPSGGLMLSLGIYNALVEEDITKGRNIIGTGTIDQNGNVGEIGGVKYKLIGAVKNKADVFICPKENYEEAMKLKKENNYDIKIIGVSTLEEAIEKLSE